MPFARFTRDRWIRSPRPRPVISHIGRYGISKLSHHHDDVVRRAGRLRRYRIADGLAVQRDGLDALLNLVRILDLDVVGGTAPLPLHGEPRPIGGNAGVDLEAGEIELDPQDVLGCGRVHPTSGTGQPWMPR